jgi:hypothetical protein
MGAELARGMDEFVEVAKQEKPASLRERGVRAAAA